MAERKCVKCGGRGFMNGFCRKHFIENIEKRVKKGIRQNSLIERNESLVAEDMLCRHFIENVINVPVKVKKSGKGRRVIPWSMDDEILQFLAALFSSKELKESEDKSIKLFRTIKDNELEAYARLKGAKFSRKRTAQERRILSELDRLEKDHKETRFSLLRSIEEIRGL